MKMSDGDTVASIGIVLPEEEPEETPVEKAAGEATTEKAAKK